jgi:seryl-tRNA synthetase
MTSRLFPIGDENEDGLFCFIYSFLIGLASLLIKRDNEHSEVSDNKKKEEDVLSLISKVKRKRKKNEKIEIKKDSNSSNFSTSSYQVGSISHSSLPPDFRSRSNKLHEYEIKLQNHRMQRRHYTNRGPSDKLDNIDKKKFHNILFYYVLLISIYICFINIDIHIY